MNDLPSEVELSTASVQGRPSQRLMVVLRAPGCQYALRTGGCSVCGYQHLTTGGARVSTEELVQQLDVALDRYADQLHKVEQLDIFCSGSFFHDDEIQPEARRELLRRASRVPSVRVVMVESRPELITDHVLEEAQAALTGPSLEVGIGLESANDTIRQERIRKGFTLSTFEQAARKLADHGVQLLVYVLLKPLGTGEEEAIEDALATARYLARLARELELIVRVALEPTFVVKGTPLHEELSAGRYTPPSLWSVLQAVRKMSQLLPVHVGLSSEGLPTELVPSGCPLCTGPIHQALAGFNQHQDRKLLADLQCPCQT